MTGAYHVRVKAYGCRNWQLLPAGSPRRNLRVVAEQCARLLVEHEQFRTGQVIQYADPRAPLVVLEMVRR